MQETAARSQSSTAGAALVDMSQTGMVAAGPVLASVSQDGSCSINFAVRSRHAARMSLCLARINAQPGSKAGFLEVSLDPIVNKSGAPLVKTSPCNHLTPHCKQCPFTELAEASQL